MNRHRPRKPRTPLLYKQMLFGIGLILAAIVPAGLIADRFVSTVIDDEVRHRLQADVQLRSQILSEYVARWRDHLSNLAEPPALLDLAAAAQDRDDRLRQLLARPSPSRLHAAWLFNHNGEAIAKTQPPSDKLSDTQEFQRALEGEFYGGPVRTGSETVLALAQPLSVAGSRFVLMVHVDAEPMLQVMQDAYEASQSNEILLATRQGERIRWLLPSRLGQGIEFSDLKPSTPTAKAIFGDQGVEQRLDYRGVPVIAAYQPIGVFDWVLVSKQDTAEVFAKQRKLRALLLAVLAFVLMCGCGASFVMARRLTQPITHLTDVAQRIAQGDRKARVELSTDDETGLLGDSINSMTEQLFQAVNSLEGTVQQRSTELQMANQALRLHQEQLDLTLAATRIGVWVWHLKSNQIDWDETMYSIFDLEPGTEVTIPLFLDLLHPDDRLRVHAATQSSYKRDSEYNSQYRILTQSGQVRHIIARGRIVEDAAGNPERFVGICLDDTAHVRAALKLSESEQRFKTAVEQSPFPAIIHADDGTILMVNDRWKELSGYSREDIPSIADWTEKAYGGRKEDISKYIQTLYQMEGRVSEGEFAIRAKDGSTRIWDFSSSALGKYEDGRRAVISQCNDVTERKRAEQALEKRTKELERSNRELDDFAYVASHDLKAPLRAIDNLSQFLEEDAKDVLTGDSLRHMQLLRERVRRMEKLLDDLLEYSRVGRFKTMPEQIDVRELIAEVVDLQDIPPEFNVKVVEPIPSVVSSRPPLQQVLRNLIGNAIKHHDKPGGTVEVSGEPIEGFIRFRVADDGPGIPGKFTERIFGIFQTLQPRDRVEGSGMGLAIVKKVIETQGGKLGVESEVGHGACFWFDWPKEPIHET